MENTRRLDVSGSPDIKKQRYYVRWIIQSYVRVLLVLACVHRGSEVGVWPTMEGCTLSKFLDEPASDDLGTSETTQLLYVCVYGMYESQRKRGRG